MGLKRFTLLSSINTLSWHMPLQTDVDCFGVSIATNVNSDKVKKTHGCFHWFHCAGTVCGTLTTSSCISKLLWILVQHGQTNQKWEPGVMGSTWICYTVPQSYSQTLWAWLLIRPITCVLIFDIHLRMAKVSAASILLYFMKGCFFKKLHFISSSHK